MQITKVVVRLATVPTERYLGTATITLDDSLVIRCIRLVRLHDGRLILAMPNRKSDLKTGDTHFDIVFPCTSAMRDAITTAVFDAYHAMTATLAEAV